jgi:hypothetical protein
MLINFHLTSKESRAQSNLFFKSISAALYVEIGEISRFFFRKREEIIDLESVVELWNIIFSQIIFQKHPKSSPLKQHPQRNALDSGPTHLTHFLLAAISLDDDEPK